MPPMDSAPNPIAPGNPPWESRRAPLRRRWLQRLMPALGILLLVTAIIWGLWPKPLRVEIAEVTRGALTVHVSEEGKTRVRNRYVVAAPAAGLMRRVTLKAGDPVVAGHTLLTTLEPAATPLLDPRARRQAETIVAGHQAGREQAAAAVTAAKAALELAQSERERLRAVRQDGSIAATERDRAETAATIRAAEVRAAEFALQVRDYELAQARMVLERPATNLDQNVIDLRSPVSGRILKVIQESESVLAPGSPILEVGDPADLEIEAEILSRDAVAIRPGDPATIEQWGGNTALTARVRRIEPAAFTKISALGVEEQRVIVLCDLLNPPEAARALGDRYRVEVRVAIWHADDVPLAPAGALFRQGSRWHTFLYQNGRAVLTPVEAGHSDGRMTEVIRGLQPGDRLLLHPPDTIHDGSPVTTEES